MQFTLVGIKRYFKNTSWLLVGQAFRMGSALVVTILIARYLGPQKFGALNYAMALTLLLGVLANLGLDGRVKKELVERPEARNEILGTYGVLTLLPALVVYAVLMAVCFGVGVDATQRMLYLWLGGVLLLSPLKGTELWFNAQVQSEYVVKAAFIGVGLSSIYKLWLILNDATLEWFAMAIFAEFLLAAAVRLYFFRTRVGPIIKLKVNFNLGQSLLRDAWPLIISSVAVTVYMQVDQVMLGWIHGEQVVGEYAAAVRLSSIWYLIPMLLGTSLFPAIVRARESSLEFYHARVLQYFQLNVLIAYAIVVPITITAAYLITFLYGHVYAAATPILIVHICSLIFVFLGVARSQVCLAEGLYKFSMVVSLSGAVLNVGINFLLIPLYSGVGAAVGTFVAQVFSSIICCLAYPPTRRFGYLMLHAVISPFGFLKRLFCR